MKGRKLRTRTHRSIIAFRPFVRRTSRLSPRICRLAHVSSSYPHARIVCVYVHTVTHVENRVSVDGYTFETIPYRTDSAVQAATPITINLFISTRHDYSLNEALV